MGADIRFHPGAYATRLAFEARVRLTQQPLLFQFCNRRIYTSPMMHASAKQAATLIIATVVSGLVGCSSSRWAMDDPAYQSKYSAPYSENDELGTLVRRAKQSVDARHLSGRSGKYAGLHYGNNPQVSADFGIFLYPPFETPWLETRAGITGLAGDTAILAAGLDAGVRAQLPTRVAPFVGAGATLAASPFASDDDDDFNSGTLDDDDDGGAYLALYPEAGIHFWLNSRLRLSAISRYYIAGSSADNDRNSDRFWAGGLQLSWLD